MDLRYMSCACLSVLWANLCLLPILVAYLPWRYDREQGRSEPLRGIELHPQGSAVLGLVLNSACCHTHCAVVSAVTCSTAWLLSSLLAPQIWEWTWMRAGWMCLPHFGLQPLWGIKWDIGKWAFSSPFWTLYQCGTWGCQTSPTYTR